jgi:hypothetical protein
MAIENVEDIESLLRAKGGFGQLTPVIRTFSPEYGWSANFDWAASITRTQYLEHSPKAKLDTDLRTDYTLFNLFETAIRRVARG